ncbi:MAG: hypothetical protein KF819_00895 [Labilithrix sp.]|nr:hypothetical protein [Labilithrix sp.]
MRLAGLRIPLAVAVLVGLAACTALTSNGDAPPPAAGEAPPEAKQDAGPSSRDGAPADGGTDDDAPAGPSGDILGTLASGSCGIVKTQLAQAAPSLESNVLVFQAGEVYERAGLSPGGQAIFDAPNAGGSSIESEVMSFEVLRYCEGAALVKTETQILYAAPDGVGPNSITDMLVSIDGKKVGVSVTRAYKPPSQPLTDVDLKDLVEKKLEGINRSSVRVLAADKWVKQILHVFAVNKAAADGVARVWATIDPAVRADTIVLVTQTTGGGFVYCNPDPPLGSECL